MSIPGCPFQCPFQDTHQFQIILVHRLVLRVDRAQASNWSDGEVIERWCRLFKGPILIQSYLAGAALSSAELDTVAEIAGVWRKRLMSLSWFMRCLNEGIARRANREDQCTGRFWEGRFRSQALLDSKALLACMAYVELNPIRAGLSKTLEDSNFTSIQERLLSLAESVQTQGGNCSPSGLLTFSAGPPSKVMTTPIPFALDSYIELVDYTGRVVRNDSKHTIPENPPLALDYVGLSRAGWLALSLDIQRRSLLAIGSLRVVERYNCSRCRRWLRGQREMAALYESG